MEMETHRERLYGKIASQAKRWSTARS